MYSWKLARSIDLSAAFNKFEGREEAPFYNIKDCEKGCCAAHFPWG